MINAFLELRSVIIYPQQPLMCDFPSCEVSKDHTLHCWKVPQNDRWYYCIRLFDSSRGSYWCYSEFEEDLFPNMITVLDGLVANSQRTDCNQTLDRVSDIKQQWIQKHGGIAWVSLFVYIVSQMSSSEFPLEVSVDVFDTLEEEGWSTQLSTLQYLLLNQYSLQERCEWHDAAADDTLHCIINLYCHVMMMIDRLLQYQTVASSVGQLSRHISGLITESLRDSDSMDTMILTSSLAHHARTFYSMSHRDRLLSALKEYPSSSSEMIELPFSSEWRQLLLSDVALIGSSTRNFSAGL